MNKARKLKRISAICAAVAFALLSIFAVLVTQNRTAYKMEVPYSAKAEEAADGEATAQTLMRFHFVLPIEIGFRDVDYDSNGIEYAAKAPYYVNLSFKDNNEISIRFTNYSNDFYDTFSVDLTEGKRFVTFSDREHCIRFSSGDDDLYVTSVHIGENFDLETFSKVGKYFFDVDTSDILEPFLVVRFTDKDNASLCYFRLNFGNGEARIPVNYMDKGKRTYFPLQSTVDISDIHFPDYEDGYKEGYTAGKNENTQSYYDKGYADGWAASGNGTFTSLFTAVIDAPVAAFTNLLDFEILGVDMKKFALSLISLALVLAIVRFVLGKS